MRVAVIRFHEEDSAGFIGAAFEARGAELSVCLFPKEGPLPALDGIDHIVVLGAVWSVYDDSPDRAWIADVLAWLRQADEAGVPVLGICFGGQALAAALGGKVIRAGQPEVGWTTVQTSRPDLVEPGPWFQWHADRWVLPDGVRALARTQAAEQAFVVARSMGVQFHPELTPQMLDGWLGNGGSQHARALGLDPGQLVAETAARSAEARARARRLVAAFLALDGPV